MTKRGKEGFQAFWKVNIPSELITSNILPRLPVTSLLRFKSVCKDWNITISSSEFAKTRLISGFTFPQFLLLLQEDDNCKIISLSYDECSNSLHNPVKFKCQYLNEYPGLYSIVDSCNGLLCLNLVNTDSFAIWNPVTNQYEQISYCQDMIDNVDVSLQAEGFGYTSSTDDYTIFAMFSEPFYPDDAFFYLFSFRAGAWKEIRLLGITHFVQTIDTYSAVCINEQLYWPRNDIQTGLIAGLFRFDLVEERMIEVQMPTSFSEHEYNTVTHIFEIDGCLSLSCTKKGEANLNNVWMFYGEGEFKSWINVFSIDTRDISVVGFTSVGSYLTRNLGQFNLVDPRKQGSEHSGKGMEYEGHIVNSWHYVQSLVNFRICKQENEEMES